MMHKKYSIVLSAVLIVAVCITYSSHYFSALKDRFTPYLSRISRPSLATLKKVPGQAWEWTKQHPKAAIVGGAAAIGIGALGYHYWLQRNVKRVSAQIAQKIIKAFITNSDTYHERVVASRGTYGTPYVKFSITTTKHTYEGSFFISIECSKGPGKSFDQIATFKINQETISLTYKNPRELTCSKYISYIQKMLPNESNIVQKAFEYLKKRSDDFDDHIRKFPTLTNRIKNIAQDNKDKQKEIVKQAQEVRVIMHDNVNRLITTFLDWKTNYGEPREKTLYTDMTLDQFIDRLLIKRPLTFMGPWDDYVLRNTIVGFNSKGNKTVFETLTTQKHEQSNVDDSLTLENYISYDEMLISALLGVSVPTYFVDNGDINAKDAQAAAPKKDFELEGVLVGLVGPRFERSNLMEWQHIIITPEQNTKKNGYGLKEGKSDKKLISKWEAFYDEKFPTFDDAKEGFETEKKIRFEKKQEEKQKEEEEEKVEVPESYIKINDKMYFNCKIYKKRLRMVIEPFLYDANDRAKRANKRAYCHVVGLGLGAWAIPKAAITSSGGSIEPEELKKLQANLFIRAFEDLLKEKIFEHISDINFSFFPAPLLFDGQQLNENASLQMKTGEKRSTINIHFSKRRPSAKLHKEDVGKLLVAMYAWDSNAYPGNEYWNNQQGGTNDPAAARSSTIAELQNPLINPRVSHYGLITYPSFAEEVKEGQKEESDKSEEEEEEEEEEKKKED